MTRPEIWGPVVWSFIHTLVYKMQDDEQRPFILQTFYMIKRICMYLPCPDCSKDATNSLNRINIQEIQTKIDLVNKMYIFHNYVNKKKGKDLFNYQNMNKYEKNNLLVTYNNFIIHYNSKGNMNLMTESFQRSMVIRDLKRWLTVNLNRFKRRTVIQETKETKEIQEIQEIEGIKVEALCCGRTKL